MGRRRTIHRTIGAAAILGACALAWRTELRYQLFGRETTADLLRVTKVYNGGMNGEERDEDQFDYAIDYRFTDLDGAARKEEDWLPYSWTPPFLGEPAAKTSIGIVYVPGEPGRSRMSGNIRWRLPALLLLALSAIIVMSGRFWNNYCEHEVRIAAERSD